MAENFEAVYQRLPMHASELGAILADPVKPGGLRTEQVLAKDLPKAADVLAEHNLDAAEAKAIKAVAAGLAQDIVRQASNAVVNPDSLKQSFGFIRAEANGRLDGSSHSLQGFATIHLDSIQRTFFPQGLDAPTLRDRVLTPALEKAIENGKAESIDTITLDFSLPGNAAGAVELKGKGWVTVVRPVRPPDEE